MSARAGIINIYYSVYFRKKLDKYFTVDVNRRRFGTLRKYFYSVCYQISYTQHFDLKCETILNKEIDFDEDGHFQERFCTDGYKHRTKGKTDG